MKIQFRQVPVKGLIERLSQQVGQVWQTQHSWQPKPGHVGPSWSDQNDSAAWMVLQLLRHFSQAGYRWEDIRVQILPGHADCVHCTGDTNCGRLLLNLMAKRSIWGWCHWGHNAWKTSGKRNHSVKMIWPSMDSLSTITFSWPRMC